MRTDEMPEGEVADRSREGRFLIYAFPPGEGFVERSISSAEYRNRADFVDGVHVEYRGDVPVSGEEAEADISPMTSGIGKGGNAPIRCMILGRLPFREKPPKAFQFINAYFPNGSTTNQGV